MKRIKKVLMSVLLITLISALCSCGLFEKTTTNSTSSTSASLESEPTKRPAQIITDLPATAPAKTSKLFIRFLEEEQEKGENKKVFLGKIINIFLLLENWQIPIV